MLHLRPMALGVTLIVLASGCRAVAPGLGGGSFQLGPAETAAGAPPAPLTAAEAPAPAQAPASAAPVLPAAPPSPALQPRSGGGSSGGGRARPAPTGTLTVDLAEVATALAPAAQRRILAAVADIDRLVITFEMEGQPDRVEEVTAAELAAGTSAIAFSALPTGTGTVTITALDATGAVIGTSSRMASIAQAQATALSVRVHVVPDDGQMYSNANSFVFGVDLQAAPAAQAPDGSGPVSGTVLESYPYSAAGGLYADNAGHFYIRRLMVGSPVQNFTGLARFSTADGTPLAEYTFSFAHGSVLRVAPTSYVYDPVHGVLVTNSWLDPSIILPEGDTSMRIIRESLGSPLAVDAAGDAFYIKDGLVQKADQTATVATAIPSHSALAIDTTGNFWVNGADDVAGVKTIRNEVRKFAPDGTLLATVALPIPAARLLSDGDGGVWVGDRVGGQLVRVAADGSAGMALGVTATDFCLDAAKNLWVAGGPTVLKLAPDGTQLGSYPIKARTITYGDGYVFVGTWGTDQAVLKVVP